MALGQKTYPVTVTILFLLVFLLTHQPPCLLHPFSSVFCAGKMWGSCKHSLFLPSTRLSGRGGQTGEWRTTWGQTHIAGSGLVGNAHDEDQGAYDDVRARALPPRGTRLLVRTLHNTPWRAAGSCVHRGTAHTATQVTVSSSSHNSFHACVNS